MTSEGNWQRARTDQQKQQRINSLAKAAETLFGRLRYDEITIAAIAKEAGFTRSNTYKYFNSKEEIFLEVLQGDLKEWIREVVETLRRGDKYTANDFAMIWTGLLMKHFRLIRILSVLFSRIDKNLSEEVLLNFKSLLHKSLTEVGTLILSIYPELEPEDTLAFLNMHFASTIGLFQMTDLTEIRKAVISNTSFSSFKMDFGEECRKSAKYLLVGLIRERGK